MHGVGAEAEAAEEYYEEEDDGLGYYADGTKRILTDEQIAMFRHSEIHAILRKRRTRREDGELSDVENALVSPPVTLESPASLCINLDTLGSTTQQGQPKSSEKVHTGRVEKSKTQQWATTSTRTKIRNKKHNHNYRRKKKEDRKRLEARTKTGDNDNDEEDESDEWDAWHQANGPDAQKDDALALDY